MGNRGCFPTAKVDRDVFYKSIEMYIRGEIRQKQAQEMCGLSNPTWRKYVKMAVFNDPTPIPESFFKEKDGES